MVSNYFDLIDRSRALLLGLAKYRLNAVKNSAFTGVVREQNFSTIFACIVL